VIFGVPATFAIETGAVERRPRDGGPYVQFRFWIDGQPYGDWEDRIPFKASVENAYTLCKNELHRREMLFDAVSTGDVFRKVYDGFFEYDYTKDPILSPNLRDRFHLDDIAMGATQDKYGIVLVAHGVASERLIVKDMRRHSFLADLRLPAGHVESVLNSYVEWGRSQVRLGP
jgi:hypothetical protein